MFYLCRPLGCSWDHICPPWALRGPRGPLKGPYWAKLSPFGAPWGPEGARYQVKVCVDHESNSGGPMGGSWDQIWLLVALRGPLGPPKGSFGAKLSPFRVPWGPEGARYQVKVCGEHESNPGRPFGGSLDQICSPGAPRGPPRAPKGAFRTKAGPFGTPRGPEGARYQVKCVVTMSPAQTGQSGAVGIKSGPPRTSGAPKRAIRA